MKLKISDETDLSIDLDVLLKTRLLVQANSGGGDCLGGATGTRQAAQRGLEPSGVNLQ